MTKTRVFVISGYSGSGKTTLLSMIVEKLNETGKSVAVIKNSKEDILAPVGTDTRKHQDAGADPVILLGPNTTTKRDRKRKDLGEILNYFETDFLLLEGFKELTIPRFWCIHTGEEIPELIPDITKAVVGWDSVKPEYKDAKIPYHDQSDVDQLIKIIENQAPLVDEIKNMLSC